MFDSFLQITGQSISNINIRHQKGKFLESQVLWVASLILHFEPVEVVSIDTEI